MVEIIPYTEDDDDQSSWIPLTPSTGSNDAPNSAANSAALDADGVSASAAQNNVVNSDSNATTNQNTRGEDNLVFVEDVDDSDDDNEEWQNPSSQSSSLEARREQHLTTAQNIHAPAGIDDLALSLLGKGLIARLTSTTMTATTSVTEVDDDVSESEENIVWRKPDDLDITDEEDVYTNDLRRNRQTNVEEEYDDENISSIRYQYREENSIGFGSGEQTSDSAQQSELDSIGEERDEYSQSAHFRHIPEQQQHQRRERQQGQQQQSHDPAQQTPSVKTKLQQKLIHDPLRQLPLCFLRHLYHETKLQLSSAWDAYSEQNELQSILAPLSLIFIASVLGIVLIGAGVFGLGNIIIRASAQVILSLSTWMLDCAWKLTTRLVWLSLCCSFGLGVLIWFRFGKSTGKNIESDMEAAFQVPSVSTLLPWAVALTSSSMAEACIIMVSLRTYLSILSPVSQATDTCDPSIENDWHNQCVADEGSQGMSTLAKCIVAILVAVMNAAIVSVAANMLDQSSNEKLGSKDGVPNVRSSMMHSTPAESPPAMQASEPSHSRETQGFLCTCLDQIQKHICMCHVISIAALAALSTLILLIHTAYVHFVNEGGSVLFAFVSAFGAVGCNLLSLGLGIFVLITLWNITATAIADNSMGLARNTSFGEISSRALKRSIMEISSRAVWSKDDLLGSLLGDLSDDDEALRLAILRWVIDRWTASPAPSEESTYSAPNMPQSSDDFSFPAASYSSETDSRNNESNPKKCNTDNNNAGLNSSKAQEQGVRTNDDKAKSKTSESQPIRQSYQSLQRVIARLDVDETLIPAIRKYRGWVYSIPPSRNAALCVSLWKMCPAAAVFVLAAIWFFGWSAFVALSNFFSIRLDSSPSTTTPTGAWMVLITVILSPLLCFEYLRVRQWWGKTIYQLRNMDYGEQAANETVQRDLVMILLQADAGGVSSWLGINTIWFVDTSLILHRIWLLLLESIEILESSIPVVRYATVASAAADLTNDTVCLVDLALEVKKRGLIGGIVMVVEDAFRYHLSAELQQRNQETNNDASSDRKHGRQAEENGDLGGKYTRASLSAVGNLGRMSRNISGLMNSMSENDNKEASNRNDGEDEKTYSNESTGAQSRDQVGSEHGDKDVGTCQSSDGHIKAELGEEFWNEVLKADDQGLESLADAKEVVDAKPCNDGKENHISSNQDREMGLQEKRGDDQDDDGVLNDGNDNDLQSNREMGLQENRELDQDGNGGLMPLLVGGGLAVASVVGAVAGIAAVTGNKSHEQEKSQNKTPKESI